MQQLLTIGTNYRRSDINLREFIQLSAQKKINFPRNFVEQGIASEALLLTTCHRTELYLVEAQCEDPIALFAECFDLDVDQVRQSIYCFRDQEVKQHLFRLAVGLDSMIVGESQILNQIKQAFSSAKQMNCIGGCLGQLVPSAIAASRRIRHNTQIGAHPISIAYIIKKKAKKLFRDMSDINVLFIGAGEMITDVTKYIGSGEFASVSFANRSYSKAKQLADMYQGNTIDFDDIEVVLPTMDMVITATSSQNILLTRPMLERMMKVRSKTLLLIDLAVPRDIEASCSELDAVSYYHLDDFQTIINASLASRAHIAQQAESLIENELVEYREQLIMSNASQMINHFRQYSDAIKDQTIQKALRRLAQGEEPERVIVRLGHELSQKLLHQPTKVFRQAVISQDQEILNVAKAMFCQETELS